MLMRYPGGLGKALTLSYDDGVEQDAVLMEILNKTGLKCTFNLNSGLWAPEDRVWPAGQIHRRLTASKARALYAGSGHEIAVHGVTHASFAGLSMPLLIEEIMEDRKNLERMFSVIVRGAAYPYGAYDGQSLQALKDCGIVYCRTVFSTRDFRVPDNFLALNPTCHHDDPALFDLLDRFLKDRGDWTCRLLYLWGHTYEFEAKNNWHVMEEFAAKASGRDDVWYCTNIQMCDYVRDFGRLEFSADGKRVYNPTASRLWFSEKGEARLIAPGESVLL